MKNYYSDNDLNFDFFTFIDDYDNKNSLYYYFIQRNLRAGKKLKCMRYFFKAISLLQLYNYYFYNKKKNAFRFYEGFGFENSFIDQYKKAYPTFALRLENEYKGKHKTKRKFMYPIFLERQKSQLNELVLLFKRISFKYKYRLFQTRLSIILFNFFYYHNTAFDKISRLNEKIYSLQRRGGKTFVNFEVKRVDFKTEKEIRRQL